MTAIACPRCGGTASKRLAPGYFECRSEVLVNVIPAGMQGNVSDIPLYDICAHRYQAPDAAAGGVAAQCSCGMFAVGACVRCGQPVCGRHANTRDGRVLCAAHAQEEAAAAAAKADAEKQHRLEEWRRATEEWEGEVVAALSAIPDATERKVRALTEIGHATTQPLQRMIPRSMSDREIADWFLRSVKQRPSTVVINHKTIFGTYKDRRRPGWSFYAGSKAIKNYPHGHEQPGSIAILQDGRIYYDRSFTPAPDDAFNEKALREMVERLGLRPLKLPPRPSHPDDHDGWVFPSLRSR